MLQKNVPIKVCRLHNIWFANIFDGFATRIAADHLQHAGSKREDCMVSWCKKRGYSAEIIPKSELRGFNWANTHNKCVHDSM